MLYSFRNIVTVLRLFTNQSLSKKLLKKLEKRWANWKKLLLLLLFLLHPKYRINKFNPAIKNLSFPYLG